MILKKEYKSNNAIRWTLIDDIDKIDSGKLDDGRDFINVYKRGRKREDDFETIIIESVNVFIMNEEGKTLQIFRG